MKEIKDNEGNILFIGTEEDVYNIRGLFIEHQIILDYEGNLQKYDLNQLYKDIIKQYINETTNNN